MNLCACMGPLRGDPYCYCEMKRRGLEPTQATDEEKEKLALALGEIFKWKERPNYERNRLE